MNTSKAKRVEELPGGRGAHLSSLETMDFGKNFYATGYTYRVFLWDRVQGVESFATHPRHFPSQVPPREELQL